MNQLVEAEIARPGTLPEYFHAVISAHSITTPLPAALVR
jgi:hypothetical protein